MAYGKKYRLQWESPGASNTLLIDEQGYSSSVTDLTPAENPVTVEWGTEGEQSIFERPLRISTASIQIRDFGAASQLAEIDGASDTDFRARWLRDGSLYWQGYVKPDLSADDPWRDYEIIELQALDGLALLEGRSYKPSAAAGDTHSIKETIVSILQGLHDLPVDIAVNWYANGTAGDPTADVHTQIEAWRESEDQESGLGEPISELGVLKGILRRFQSHLFEVKGRWVARQREAISGQSLDVYTYTSPTGSGTSNTRDLSASLPPILAETRRPRSRVRRVKRAQSTYEFGELRNPIPNASFETDSDADGDPDDWTLNSYGSGALRALRNDRAGAQFGPGAFQNDEWKAQVTYDQSFASDRTEDMVVQDSPADFSSPGLPGAVFEFGLEAGYNNRSALLQLKARVNYGGYYLTERTTPVLTDTLKAEEGTLNVGAVAAPIPSGTTCFILDSQADNGNPSPEATIKLSETADRGARTLRGSVPEITLSDFPNEPVLYYYTWEPTSSLLDLHHLIRGGVWQTHTARAFLQTEGGAVVSGESLSVDLVAEAQTTGGNPNLVCHIDNLNAQLKRNGEALTQFTAAASDKSVGQEVSVGHRVGDGPTTGTDRSLLVNGSETGGWGVGSSGSFNLDELFVRRLMAAQRQQLERYTISGAHEALTPEDVATIDGTGFELTFLEHRGGNDDVRAELTELADFGTSGLTEGRASTEPPSGSVTVVPGGSGSSSTGDVEVLEVDASTTLPDPLGGTLYVVNTTNDEVFVDHGAGLVTPTGTVSALALGPLETVAFAAAGSQWRLESRRTRTIELDASGGNVTKTLPDPVGSVVVYRSDTTGSTAEVQHENDIATDDGVVDLLPIDSRQTMRLEAVTGGETTGGSSVARQWRLVGSQATEERLKSYTNGRPVANEVVWGAQMSEAKELTKVTIAVDTSPSGSVTFDVVLNGTSIGTVSPGSSTAFSQQLASGDRLKVLAPDPADTQMEGVYTTVVMG